MRARATPGFAGILGQDAAIAFLRRALSTDRIPHAIALVGPDGVGKTTLARAFASAVLCDGGRDDACGTCRGCLRTDHGNHPDFLVVTRQPKRKGADAQDDDVGEGDLRPFIVIDQIREMNEHAGYPPAEGRRRIFLIDPADRMNPEAQNALLKTLEEPSSRTVVVLTANRPNLLLATVRSRCLTVSLAPMTAADLASALASRGMSADEAAARAALAGGRPGRALALDVDGLVARRAEILEDLEAFARSPTAAADLPGAAARIVGSDEESFLEGLELIQTLLRDAALPGGSGPTPARVHVDLAGRTAALGARIGALRAARLVEAVDESRARTRFHANRTYLAEALLAAIAGAPVPGRDADL